MVYNPSFIYNLKVSTYAKVFPKAKVILPDDAPDCFINGNHLKYTHCLDCDGTWMVTARNNVVFLYRYRFQHLNKSQETCFRVKKLEMNPKRLEGHHGLVDRVRIKADLVVSSGADRQVRMWSAWSGTCCRVLNIQLVVKELTEGCFPLVDISGNRLVAVNFDTVYVWDLQESQTDEPIRQFSANERITDIHLTNSTLKFSCYKSVHSYDFWDAT